MNKEQNEKVVQALVDFVVRVANGEATSEAEVAALPEIARILLK